MIKQPGSTPVDNAELVAIGEAERFEERLARAIQPFRGMALAAAIHAFFETGLHDVIQRTPISVQDMDGYHHERLDALLRFLANEGILERRDGVYSMTEEGAGLSIARPWYTLMVGGYAETFRDLSVALLAGMPPAPRDAVHVGAGSCGISQHGAIPLTRELMKRIPGACRSILDLGCGTGLYLAELCATDPRLIGHGAEPDLGGYEAASALIRERGLDSRISIYNSEALEFLERYRGPDPDALIFGFVLHEIHGQRGEEGVIEILKHSIDRFPSAHIVVIEVDWRPDDLSSLASGLGLSYYNPYYLLHPFTQQRLRPAEYWEDLFEASDLAIVERRTIDPDVDSTGLEIGYLLRRTSASG